MPIHPVKRGLRASPFGQPLSCPALPCSYYSSEAELHRLFKGVNGIIFPGESPATECYTVSPLGTTAAASDQRERGGAAACRGRVVLPQHQWIGPRTWSECSPGPPGMSLKTLEPEN